MNFLRKISGLAIDPLDSRLERYVTRHRRQPTWLSAHAKQLHHPGVELFRDANGIIRHLRIGAWRIIAASKSRRIVEVRDLACNRIAVRIDRDGHPNWELYDLDGHLLAMLQKIPQEDGWLETDFETGEVSRIIAGLRLAPDPRTLPTTSRPSACVGGELPALGLLPCSG